MAERVSRLSMEKAVVIFTRSQCPMCHTVLSLFAELSVYAAVHELDKDPPTRSCRRTSLASSCPCSRPLAPYGSECHPYISDGIYIITHTPIVFLGLYINSQIARLKFIKLQGASNKNI
ncbi:unnamed protein product [Urochloa humidicola]